MMRANLVANVYNFFVADPTTGWECNLSFPLFTAKGFFDSGRGMYKGGLVDGRGCCPFLVK